MQTLAIVVAAGRGERMGADRPKAFVTLRGKSLLLRSAAALAGGADGLVAVVPGEAVAEAARMLADVPQVRAVVAGGATRAESVRAGLEAVPSGFDGIVLVHDAARPLVPPDLVRAVAEAARRTGAALPVLPLLDTIKVVGDGRVVETLDRTRLGAAQTPQGFRIGLLREAYARAFADDVALTDEAMAVERLGHPVAAVPGSPRNRKITTPDDLRWAESLLEGEER
jgi:2-C-methyl-D-erythritol 4-phosphate cytidylyltransferase